MRHLYNEDYSDLESASSSMTIKQHDNIMCNEGDKDAISDIKSTSELIMNSDDIHAEGKEDPEHINPPEDLIQSFSTLSGIALPVATRFVRICLL